MTLVLGIAAALMVVVVLTRLLENRFIFFPPRYPAGFVNPAAYGIPVEEVWIATQDGVRLNAWFLPEPTTPKVLLVFHGNADNIGYTLDRLRSFWRLGVNVLALDYRGYGKSEGSPDEAGVYRDAEAAYDYLIAVRQFPPQSVYLYGQSLGGAVAIDLAARHACGGLIVESSFTSGRAMARRMFRIPLFEYVPKSRFDSLAKIARVRCPVLVIHGTQDELVPFSMSRQLYAAAPEPKAFLPIEGAGHNNLQEVGGVEYLTALRRVMGLPTPEVRAGAASGGGRAHEVR